ncbi:MAG: glycogen synthase [Candidatus Eisenbacteria sp.]|nr:glycogen synthase [Candidatus Eisenbacteria bacterium]
MRILMASAEVAPFARVGGLSDVVGALSKAAAELGHEVSVFLPKYRSVDAESYGFTRLADLGALAVPMGEKGETVEIWRGPMPGCDDVTVYLIGHDGYFNREGIYVDPKTRQGYPDEVERYALFSRAILEAAVALELSPDVLHLNDHHTAMAAVYLRELYGDTPGTESAGVIFSIHNLGYLGQFESGLLPSLGFSEDLCVPGSPFEYNGTVSTLKLGIEFADYVNTVSERYAEEISSLPEFGLGLEGVLAEKRDNGRLLGILNGVDYSVWDPSVDTLIPARYSAQDMDGKGVCKTELLERSGLPCDTDVPVIGMVSRLADQKGFDLLKENAEAILQTGVALVILGTGQEEYHEFLSGLADEHPERVAAHLTFNNELAHLIEAGSDMFLMPSRYEPCGLNQMYSLRYGTVPIVRATGGLADTVLDFDPSTGTGTGFVFEEYEAVAMLEAVARAVAAHGDGEAWKGLMSRGMALDYSWGASAGKYVELYGRARAVSVRS